MNMVGTRRNGFTIVELLIVIVVIGILAAITIVAYNGIQARASDARMQTAVNQIEKAMVLWGSENGSSIKGGLNSTVASGVSGCSDGVNGFFGTGTYICSAEENFVVTKLLPSGFSQALPNNTYYASSSGGKYSVMLYTCTPAGAGKWALYWTLQAPAATDSANINATIASCLNPASIRDTWGMRSAKIIQL